MPVFTNSPARGSVKVSTRVVRRLGLGVWVSAGFQIFALTAGRKMSYVGREIVWRGNVRGICLRGGMSRENVLHSITADVFRVSSPATTKRLN